MLTGWRDFDEALRSIDWLHRHIDVVFDDRIGSGPGRERPWRRATWPAVNVVETKDAFVYRAEVPGLGEGDVVVQVEDESLLLRGERKSDAPKGYEVHLRERAPVAFARKLPLPGRVDAEGVTATMKDGVLTVTLPTSKDTLPRQIAVKAL
jgi:HSP20 family protein